MLDYQQTRKVYALLSEKPGIVCNTVKPVTSDFVAVKKAIPYIKG